MIPMKAGIDWGAVEFFNPSENWGDIDKIEPLLVYTLDEFRRFVGSPIIINNAWRRTPGSTHDSGLAADIVIRGLSVVDQFLAAERFNRWSGIGVYPFWNMPGLHVDIRPLTPTHTRPRWGRRADGAYVRLSEQFLMFR